MKSWNIVSSDSSPKRHLALITRYWDPHCWIPICRKEGYWRIAGPEDNDKAYCRNCLRIARAWAKHLTAKVASAEAMNRKLEQ